MKLIQTVTVGAGGSSTIDFTSIPQTYTDLIILFSGRSNRASYFDNLRVMPNGATTGVSSRILFGTGSAASSFTEAYISAYTAGNSVTASTFGNTSIYIPNYTSSSQKSFSMESVGENNATSSVTAISAGLWTGTDPITSIILDQGDGTTWLEYTSASLYGVTKYGTGAPKATGGTITFDVANSKWVHTFTSSGTFTPTENLTGVEYLVVGGGGGGGMTGGGGGGGAGGLRSTTTATGGGGSLEATLSLTASTNYTVTIGAGGSGSSAGGVDASDGSNSVFGSITATGGGGGTSGDTNGRPGGSGGGAGMTGNLITYTGGAGTANQGYAGGTNFGDGSGNTRRYQGGGGGGAGAGGANGSAGQAGAGGAGVTVAISGASVAYAGGGGGAGGRESIAPASYGAVGGVGGGGTGAGDSTSPTAGTANRGGGGGGGRTVPGAQNGQNGGSGIVIVRYSA